MIFYFLVVLSKQGPCSPGSAMCDENLLSYCNQDGEWIGINCEEGSKCGLSGNAIKCVKNEELNQDNEEKQEKEVQGKKNQEGLNNGKDTDQNQNMEKSGEHIKGNDRKQNDEKNGDPSTQQPQNQSKNGKEKMNDFLKDNENAKQKDAAKKKIAPHEKQDNHGIKNKSKKKKKNRKKKIKKAVEDEESSSTEYVYVTQITQPKIQTIEILPNHSCCNDKVTVWKTVTKHVMPEEVRVEVSNDGQGVPINVPKVVYASHHASPTQIHEYLMAHKSPLVCKEVPKENKKTSGNIKPKNNEESKTAGDAKPGGDKTTSPSGEGAVNSKSKVSESKSSSAGAGGQTKTSGSGSGGGTKPGGSESKPSSSSGGGGAEPKAGGSKTDSGGQSGGPSGSGAAAAGGGAKAGGSGAAAGGGAKAGGGGAAAGGGSKAGGSGAAAGGGAASGGGSKAGGSGAAVKPPGGGGASITAEQLSSAIEANGIAVPEEKVLTAVVESVNESMESNEEAAMFVAQCMHESQGFLHVEEIACKDNPEGCAQNYWDDTGVPGKSYHGRGFIQLSWPANYKAAGEALGMGDELLNNPELVADDPKIAIATAIWFWVDRVRPEGGVEQNKFGLTTKAINGPLECSGGGGEIPAKRYEIYKKVAESFGVTNIASAEGC